MHCPDKMDFFRVLAHCAHYYDLPETTGRKAESDIEEELEVLIRPLDEL